MGSGLMSGACMKALFTIAIFAASLALAQTDSTQPGKGGTPADPSLGAAPFLQRASEGNMAEIQMGQLAQKNAANPLVKQDGEKMVTDHTMLENQVKQVASQLTITLPTTLNSKDRAAYKRLESKNGADFDKAYVEVMLTGHRKDVAEFKREIANTNNSDVKTLAEKALPVIEEHLQLWESAAKQLGIPTTATSGGMR